MNPEFKSKYCRFCYNSIIKDTQGLICALKERPEINHNSCSQFDPNQELIDRTEYNNQIAQKKVNKQKILAIILVGLALTISLINFIANFVDKETLNSNHRYTISKVHITSQSGTNKILGFGGYRCEFEYQFSLGSSNYYNTSAIGNAKWNKLDKPIWNTQLLVKFNPENPAHHKVVYDIDVENVKIKNIPSNGISPDSLNLFISNNLN